MKMVLLFFSILLLNCNSKSNKESALDEIPLKKEEVKSVQVIQKDTLKIANSFDFPVGKPDAKGYYNAQKFGENYHLGDDWNGVGGGNTDLGDNIYSIADGYVVFAENISGGWGNVIRIVHYLENGTQVESLYAHCDAIFISKGDVVTKGQKIGTIGTNDGQYLAHLHFEIRNEIGLPIGGGYSPETKGYLDPTKFIKNNR